MSPRPRNHETAGLRSGITSPRRSPWGKDCGWIRNHRGRDSAYERGGMSTFPGSPWVLKGGIVLLDSTSGAVHRIITFQYNPRHAHAVSRHFGVAGGGLFPQA